MFDTTDIENFPLELRIAQEAINLPEVIEAMKILSKYNLGVFMPHMHDPKTGKFCVLPPDFVSVEDGLEVSFCTKSELSEKESIVVGWTWSEGSLNTVAGCQERQICRQGYNPDGTTYHKPGKVHSADGPE